MNLQFSRADVDFLLFDWLKVERLTAWPRYGEHNRGTFASSLDLYEQLAAEVFAPHNKKNDQSEPVFDGTRVHLNPEIAAAMAAFSASGLGAAVHGEEMGGMCLPYVVERAGFAYLLAANPATAGYAFLTMANANLLLTFGSETQVERFVRPMLDGRYFGTMCLSEPGAGSSLADITTRAERQEDGSYRLFGNKMWISAGEHELGENIVHLVLAKCIEPGGTVSLGIAGISLFAVPKFIVDHEGALGERNDVVLAGLNHKMGHRGTTNCLLNFGEGRFKPGNKSGAVGELIGDEGRGLACMFHMMNEARIGVGLGATALGYTGYLHALEYAKSRRQGRRPGERDLTQPPVRLINHSDVRRMLLAQKAYVEGALALSYLTASLVDAEHDPNDDARHESRTLLDLLTPVAKSWPSQWCLVANDLSIQVHGGYGYTRDYNVEQFYRDNRLNPIHEGTHGIQAIDLLGRRVAAREGEAMRLLGARIARTASAARACGELARYAVGLTESWSRIEQITRELLDLPDPVRRMANATAYMEAFGHVVVAWLWLDQAVVAQDISDHSREAFREGKFAACRFFYLWELPKVTAWLSVLSPLETTPLEMSEAAF